MCMANLLPRSPTPHEEHAYHQWARKFLWNDRRCDRCGVLLPEAEPHIHDVWENGRKVPEAVYCTEACYALDRQRELTTRGGLK